MKGQVRADVVAMVLLDGGRSPVNLSLRYDVADPYAVTLVFSGDGLEVQWVVARSLLQDGAVLSYRGLGDVRVWSMRDRLMLRLKGLPQDLGARSEVTVELDKASVLGFLDETVRLVEYGAERVDVDAAIERLLAEAS